jgi:hypothetical protein
MDFHEALKISGGTLALLLFIPMAFQILKDDGAGQSFATWILWAVMDFILAARIPSGFFPRQNQLRQRFVWFIVKPQ